MSGLKTIAMYLPQFHEVSENNLWWGNGYTEWTAVKNAESFFEGHNQPREPLNKNYYNLLDKHTMKEQANMAKEFGLDGFCFYHYYFKNGRKILEKPAENLLQWRDLDMPFCFCWANESWGRTWSKFDYSVNSWAIKYEQGDEKINESNGILLEQRYGRELEWHNHLEYLLPFFKDKRYIKFNNAPVFLIYKPNTIDCLPEMINYWKKISRQNGIEDIYIIGLSTVKKTKGLDAVLFHGPAMYCSSGMRKNIVKECYKNGIKNYKYEDIWKNAIAMEKIPGCKTYFGAFTDYDDTPRRGKYGWYLDDVSLELFEKYLYLLMKKNRELDNEFVFINAFNEWGEGMYLEPDKKNGYGYLEILKKVKEKINHKINLNQNSESKIIYSEESVFKYKSEKFWSYVCLMDKWMALREQGKALSDYLKRYQYNKIAVYGLGVLGKRLIPELIKDEIKIEYIIDRNNKVFYPGIDVCSLSDKLKKVDAIIVTTTYDYQFNDIWDEIRRSKINYPIVSLLEMINEL